MKNFDFTNEEMSVLLMSLIERRDSINQLLNSDGLSDNGRTAYFHEMEVVDNLLKRFFPAKSIKVS